MSKTVTLRLDDTDYDLFIKYAENDNRNLSNFIETATKRYIEEKMMADKYEMEGIKKDEDLNQSLKRAYKDAKGGKGNIVA
jgi:hypothetical protein